MIKDNKAITLITLTVTIAILVILTFTISVNVNQYGNQKRKANFQTDMEVLKQEIDQYYARKKALPIRNEFTNTTMLQGIKNVNDNDKYYVIAIEQLGVKLYYGADYKDVLLKEKTVEITDLLDVYIVNEESHTIYYPKGIQYDGKVHYMLDNIYYNKINLSKRNK